MSKSPHTRSKQHLWLAVLAICLSIAPYDSSLAARSSDGDSYTSHGKKIRVEWFKPRAGVKVQKDKTVVLILPGSGGIEPEGGFFRSIAQSLADAGATAVLIHYMDRSGLESASSAQMSAHFGEWLQTTKDAVDYVKKLPSYADSRVSLSGHSLGAQLALHEAAGDERIVSVLDMAGSFVLPTTSIKHMPPVLILHCRNDRTVPITRERQLVSILKRTHTSYSENLFPGGDHAFTGVSFEELTKLMKNFLGLTPAGQKS